MVLLLLQEMEFEPSNPKVLMDLSKGKALALEIISCMEKVAL